MEPSEYRIVLEISSRVAQGESLRAIARVLNERKVPTRYGKKWNHEVVKNVYQRHKQEITMT